MKHSSFDTYIIPTDATHKYDSPESGYLQYLKIEEGPIVNFWNGKEWKVAGFFTTNYDCTVKSLLEHGLLYPIKHEPIEMKPQVINKVKSKPRKINKQKGVKSNIIELNNWKRK